MFVENKWKPSKNQSAEYNKARTAFGHKVEEPFMYWPTKVMLGLIVAALILLGYAAVQSYKERERIAAIQERRARRIVEEKKANVQLPTYEEHPGAGKNALSTSTAILRAEFITFGDYYEPIIGREFTSFKTYDRPLNIKVDVDNYYDISRKVNLDPYIDNLNENGFSVMQLKDIGAKDLSDMYSAYRYLINQDLPIVVTNDLILYYFQNELKQVYKEIEKSAFYENVWLIYKDLYDIALARYKRSLDEKGLVNDPLLEGQRLETAYFAVALQLLSPERSQINRNVQLADANKFSEQEALEFNFDMPDDLNIQVVKEVENIHKHALKRKSPVFLYPIDYNEFKIPDNYQSNAKLHNFFLASRWLNSVFPLYHKSEKCEECLLDYDDWTINMIAASYIAKDLYSNQFLKNHWAIVYKFISFFSGLRKDLTYLDYYDVYANNFGEDYDPAQIFSQDKEKIRVILEEFVQEIEKIEFLVIEGSYPRSGDSLNQALGMRLLQRGYWPNDYIYGELVGNELKLIANEKRAKLVTSCTKGETTAYRCRGTGLDLMNILDPIEYDYAYFQTNTNYQDYNRQVKLIKRELDDFDVYAWNNNIYWVTLDIIRDFLDDDNRAMPSYKKSDIWQKDKNVNTALGTWVNLHLPADQLERYTSERGRQGLGVYQKCNGLNYIEPNPDLIDSLKAKINMLDEMMMVMKISETTNAASIELRELTNKLNDLQALMYKVMDRESFSDDDCKFLNDFAGAFKVAKSGNKSFSLKFQGKFPLRESISGVKLISLIYEQDKKKIITFGLIFNYREAAGS